MKRRGFFATLLGAIGLLGTRPSSASTALSDPMQPYCKLTNRERWVFLRESELRWLEEATRLANRVAQDQREVLVEKAMTGQPLLVVSQDMDA